MYWISVADRLPDITAAKIRVRDWHEKEFYAFFYQDAMCWISFYGLKPTNWWAATHPYDPLYNITHWLEVKSKHLSALISNDRAHT